jgi:hypothetical protein
MEDGAVCGPGGGGDNREVSLEILFVGVGVLLSDFGLIIVVLMLRRLSNVVGFFEIGRGVERDRKVRRS